MTMAKERSVKITITQSQSLALQEILNRAREHNILPPVDSPERKDYEMAHEALVVCHQIAKYRIN